MKFSGPEYWIFWVTALAVPAVLSFFLSGKPAEYLRKVLLALGTVFVLMFIYQLVSNPEKLAKATARVGVDQAEMPLRVQSAVIAGQKMLFHELAEKLGDKEPPPRSNLSGHSEAQDVAEKALKKAIQQAPDSVQLKAKLIVVESQTVHNDEHNEERDLLIKQLVDSKDEQARSVGNAVAAIYQGPRGTSLKEQEDSISHTLQENLGEGWYLEHALSDLYANSEDNGRLGSHQDKMQQRYQHMFTRFAVIIGIAIFSGLIGVVVILFQLGTMSRNKPPLLDAVGTKVPWLAMYSVFLGWFCTQLLCSYIFHEFAKRFPQTSTDPLAISSFTAATYVISNGPAIYFVWRALKSQELPFWKSLHLTLKTSTAGPIRLLIYGYLGWCAAFPLILVSAMIATKVFGTQGSDNPVIAQIVQAASSPNLLATFLFYLTLGVLAPMCEEVLFRGFFYSSLKPKLGSTLSMVITAALFALMHFDKGGVLMLFTIGFVLAYIFEKTRSLVPAMITHGLWNSGSFTLALVLFGTR